MKKVKKVLIGALSVVLLSMYSLGVCAASSSHVHVYTLYNIRQVYENTKRNCVYDKACEITTKGFFVEDICGICKYVKSRTETTTKHSVYH